MATRKYTHSPEHRMHFLPQTVGSGTFLVTVVGRNQGIAHPKCTSTSQGVTLQPPHLLKCPSNPHSQRKADRPSTAEKTTLLNTNGCCLQTHTTCVPPLFVCLFSECTHSKRPARLVSQHTQHSLSPSTASSTHNSSTALFFVH